jgi:hypothetical protein
MQYLAAQLVTVMEYVLSRMCRLGPGAHTEIGSEWPIAPGNWWELKVEMIAMNRQWSVNSETQNREWV